MMNMIGAGAREINYYNADKKAKKKSDRLLSAMLNKEFFFSSPRDTVHFVDLLLFAPIGNK